MGTVIQFSDYQHTTTDSACDNDSLIPVEFGVGLGDFAQCMALIARHGNGAVTVRPVRDDSSEVVYLMRVRDAIALNKRLLETVELSDQDITRCIDLIQLLENINTSLLETIWSSIQPQHGMGH